MTVKQKEILVALASDACAYGVQISKQALHGEEISQDEIATQLGALVTLADHKLNDANLKT